MPLSPDLLEILACPKCKGHVELAKDESGFACRACKLLYPIVDDVPNFLVDEAKPLE